MKGKKKLSEIGEFGYIETISGKFRDLLPSGITGIGDDCAVIPGTDGSVKLITTDLLIEDVHFLQDSISGTELGHKSLAVNLSDIAAMGGKALGSFLSIAIPVDMDMDYLDAFTDGFKRLSEKYACPLLGGDTTKSKGPLCINVCVMGEMKSDRVKYRKSALEGDLVCLSGMVGDSAGGLQLILDRDELIGEAEQILVKRHLTPEPHIHEGLFLSGYPSVHAMMDVSDGIASDLGHILKASGKSARINLDHLPVSPELRKLGAERSWNIYDMAASGGEDYCLLFTIDEDAFVGIHESYQDRFKKALYPIGRIEKGSGEIQYFNNHEKVELGKSGFDHFQ